MNYKSVVIVINCDKHLFLALDKKKVEEKNEEKKRMKKAKNPQHLHFPHGKHRF